MKRRAQPAAMEEEDPRTGQARPNTRTSASIFTQTQDSFPAQRSPRGKPQPTARGYMPSIPLGSLVDAVADKPSGGLLTFLAGEHDDNHLVWKESGKHRVFFYPDRVVNSETGTHATREITISRRDLAYPNPELTIGQRVFTPSGGVALRAHQLCFGPRIDPNTPYTFLRLGDEIPGVGCPDLKCTFGIASDWGAAARRADTSRFDRQVSVPVTLADVQADRKVAYDVQNRRVAPRGVRPAVGVEVSAAKLFPNVAAAGFERRTRRRTEGEREGIKSVLVKLIGAGDKIGDGNVRADVDVKFVLMRGCLVNT